MSGVKLVNKKTNELVDFDPSTVSQAISSGEFAFDKTRNYPVIDNGEPKFVKWEDASKYRDRLEFTTPDEVKNYKAEQRMSGVLPKLGAAAYGVGTGLTLGALPYAVSTLGGEAGRQYAEDVERGAPKSMLVGEVAGSLIDPFALGGRLLGKGAAKAATRVAPEILEGLGEIGARQVESQFGKGVELKLGAKKAAAEAAEKEAGARSLARGMEPGAIGPVEDVAAQREAMTADKWSRLGDINASIEEESASLARTMKSLKRAKSEKTMARLEAEKEAALGRLNDLSLQRSVTETHGARELSDLESRAARSELLQGEAPAWQAEAQRLGEQARGMEEAAALEPQLGPKLPTRELGAEELASIGLPQAAPTAAERMGPIAKGMLEQGAYGTLRTRGSQVAGTEEGGWGDALKVGALGALAVPALHLGGAGLAKAGGAAASAAGEAAPTLGKSLSEALEKGASRLEQASILRTFGITSGQAGRVQRVLYNPEVEHLGTKELTDFVRRGLADVDALKALPENAGNVNLQSIDAAGGLRKMTEEQRLAFTHGMNNAFDAKRDAIFQQVGNPEIDEMTMQSLIHHGVPLKGTGGTGLEQITPFVRELEANLQEGTFNLRDLQRMKTAFGQALEQAHANTAWRKEETAFYNALKDAIHEKVAAASPDLLEQLSAVDRGSQMAIELRKGAERLAASHATSQILGPDLLAQIGLGAFAMGRPFSAISFGVGAVALRAINLHRGDGIIADLAGNFGKTMAVNPQQAAQQAAQSIIKAKTPMMTGLAAAQLTGAEPQSYSQMSSLVRQLGEQREATKAAMSAELASLPPAERQKYVDYFDAQVSALQSAQPKGIPTGEALTQQQKDFVVFSRSVLNPTYGMQVILNGGPEAAQAAKGLQATPQGMQTMAALQQQFAAAMNENTKLRSDVQFQAAVRNFSRVSKKGSVSLAMLYPEAQQGGQEAQQPAPKVNAAGQKRAAEAFSGTVK